MANVKISGLTAAGGVVGAMELEVNNSGTSNKVTATQVNTFIASATKTLTNTTFDADGSGNSISNIENADIKSGAAIDASKLADGSVSNTEFQYLGSVTSDIQTQIDAKQGSDSTLTALASYNTNGLFTQTAADTFTGRTITGGTGVDITNGDGVSGNPTVAISSAVTTLTGSQTLTNKTLTTPQINGVKLAYVSKTGNYTATATDTYINVDATGGAVTITLPAASGNTGLEINVKKIDSSVNGVIIDGNGSETIDGATTRTIAVQYTAYTLVCTGSSWSIF